jgi:hypothetical protein
MTYEERRAWIMVAVSLAAYATYVVLVLSRADGPLADAAYEKTLFWSVGGAIAASIVLNIAAGMVFSDGSDKKDQRDREIYRFGEHIGGSMVVIGAVSALAMALLEWPYFWIANAIYLAFVLSALLSSTAKIFAYRKGFHPW